MIHIVTLTLLLLSCVISPSVALLAEGHGNGNGHGHGGSGGGGCVDGCEVEHEIKSQGKNIVEIKEFNIKVDSIKVDVDNRRVCQSGFDSIKHQCIKICIPQYGSLSNPLCQQCVATCVDSTTTTTTTTTVTPPLDSSTPVFPDTTVPNQPDTTETVLGELDASQPANVSTQGLPGGIPIVSGPIITCFTYRIDYDPKHHIPVVTFIIRGSGFDITSFIDTNLVKQLGPLIVPRIYLGNICLTVCKFTDTYIEARFEDIEDQKHFKPGTYLLVVKVLHIEKLKVPIIGITSNTPTLSTLGGLTLPELSIIGPKFPVLPIVSNPLITLFNGLKFDIATLSVTFAAPDCDKIKAACKVI